MMTATATTANAILELIQHEPLVFESSMTKEQFNKFVLRHTDLRIERDKYGTITIHPPPTLKSSFYEGLAFTKLSNWSIANPRRGTAYSVSASFNLPDGSQHKAEGAWISKQRLDLLTEEEEESIPDIVPDFVMKVISKTDKLKKLQAKMDTWMENGVRLAWLIDPRKENAWGYRADGSVEEITDFEQSLSGEDVLPGFRFNLWELGALNHGDFENHHDLIPR